MDQSKPNMKISTQNALTRDASAMNGDSGTATVAPDRQPWHALSTEEVIARTHTRPEGLTNAEAAQGLKIYGPNLIPRGKGDGALELI